MSFINLHTHQIPKDENVISILNRYPKSIPNSNFFSIGIHPWFIEKETYQKDLDLIEKYVLDKKCLAIGECGLDKVKGADIKLQIKIFKEQILLSEKYKKPVIIHCVKAYQEIIAIKKELKPKQVWILHGFHKNRNLLKQLIKHNIKISIGAAILKSENLKEIIKDIPDADLFLETDNTQIRIQDIYQKVSSIKKIEIEELKENICQNFNTIFIQ